jgi:uncharacterized membrane protein
MTDREPVLFEATLRPNPPMPPAALRLVLALVAAINLAFGLVFVLRGAWLITPFMGLDIALLAWAFRASVRASRRREHVVLTPSNLLVERLPPDGPPIAVALNPYWVRVDMEDPPEHWSQLTLWSHGKGVRLGAFLPPAARLDLAHGLKSALRRARETIPG